MKKRSFITVILFLAVTLLGSTAWAALTQTQVSQLYVGVFGRASEGGGNSYWQNDPSSTSMTVTANVMLNTEPAKAYFGATLYDNRAFIEHIYFHTLGKTYTEDPDGVDYWVGELYGGKSKGEVIAALIVAAQLPENAGAAQDQFNNKVQVSNYCADTITDYTVLETFTGFIAGVTDDEASVTASIELINQEYEGLNGGVQKSFSPRPSETQPILSYRYKVNNGQPIQVYSDGYYLTMQFEELFVIVNYEDTESGRLMVRQGQVGGRISGEATGTFTTSSTEYLTASDAALVNGQTIDIYMGLSADGETVDVDIHAETDLNEPMAYLLDRSDLDELPLGRYDLQGAVDGYLDGYVYISSAGYGHYEPFSGPITSTESWEIVDKLESYTVQGITYHNVVVVVRNADVPSFTYPYYQEDFSMTYWVAEGIGMIKGSGQYQILGEPLDIELVETNLVQ